MDCTVIKVNLFQTQGNILIDNESFTCISSTANCNHFSSSTYNAYFNTSKGTYTFYDTLSAGLGIPEEFDFAIDVTPSNLRVIHTRLKLLIF